jgi:hypothetical protein
MPRATMRREDGLLIGPYSANAREPLGPQATPFCREGSGDTTRVAAGFSGSLRSGSWGDFLAESLGIGDPLPLIAL